MRGSHRLRFAGTALVVATLAAGGTVAAGALATGDAPRALDGTPSYAAVARSTQEPTDRVEEMAAVMTNRFPDLADAEIQGVRADDGTQAWVITGTDHTCFGADNSGGTGYTCAPNGVAAGAPLSVLEAHEDGSARGVFLVPDAVRALSVDGETVAPTRNVVVVDDLAEDDALRAVRRDGTTVAVGH